MSLINNKFWSNKNFVALDIETTGLNPSVSEIIELGAVLYKEGVQVETFSCLVKPSKSIPVFIKQLTGIGDEEVKKGKPTKTALEELLAFIGDYPLLCHNSSFDISFIQHHLTLHNLPFINNRVNDTLEISRIYLPFVANHKLSYLADAFKLKPSVHHRALSDANSAGDLYLALSDFILEYIPFELNVFLSEMTSFNDSNQFLADYFKEIVSYQRQYALVNNDSKGSKLFASEWAEILGFNKSFNLIRRSSDTKDDFLFNFDSVDFPPSEEETTATAQNPEKDTSFIDNVFNTDGSLAKLFPSYEYREEQVAMAKGVETALNNKELLLVEAGTGVGKTFAYTIPAINFSYQNTKKVIVSTNTKNLQEQLFHKDIPLIHDCVDIPFQAVILKGRDNYLCYHKWNDILSNYRKLLTPYEINALTYLPVWQFFTKTGDISENSSVGSDKSSNGKGSVHSMLWRKLSSERYFCSGKRCPRFSDCYYFKIRRNAEKSNLIIVNHSLLLTDLSKDKLSKESDNYLIIDEAHNLPELASEYLGVSLSYSDFTHFYSQLISTRKSFQYGALANLKAAIQKSTLPQADKTMFHSSLDSLIQDIDEAKDGANQIFCDIADLVRIDGSYGKLRVQENGFKSAQHKMYLTLINGINTLIDLSANLHSKIFAISRSMLSYSKNQIADYDDHQDKISGSLERAKELIEALQTLKNPDFKNNAYWLSSFNTSDQSYPAGVINYAPLDVSELLQHLLYANVKSIIFTSATLALRDSFKYFRLRMGIDLIKDKTLTELVVHSPFNYDTQTKVIIPSFLPIPSDDFFHPQAIDLLKTSILNSKVGTMVLFTSYKDLNTVYDSLVDELFERNILLLAQGKGYSRTAALNEFKADGNAVLLGTNSFWEGIDVPGQSLSLLIVYKLPFQVPSEPIIEAYYEKLRNENKDPFQHCTLPTAMLRLRQGFGRLIRNKSDNGVVLILDSRIVNKKYGAYFREIIPTKIDSLPNPVAVSETIMESFRERLIKK